METFPSNPREVRLGVGGLKVDGHTRDLIAAEYHFWRQPAVFWTETLDAIKRSGIEIVSTFVCWDFHEAARGEFDFEGKRAPESDLLGFLRLCADKGIDMILRPGPIIDAEWETRGPAQDVCTLERNQPFFLERSTEYLAALAEAVAPLQATRGGPIIVVAVDNEIYFPYASDITWHEEDGDVFIPYDREFAEATYREWLEKRFGSIDELNSAFGTTFPDFEKVGAPRFQTGSREEVLTGFAFMDDYCAGYLDCHAATLREHGIDVPLYTNQKQFLAYLDWSVVGRSLDSVGINLCMPNLVPGDQALTMAWFVRQQRMRCGDFAWSPEYQAGWIGFDEMYGVISAEHGLYMGLLGAALGLRGMSFFMYVERDDWNWSPINSLGKVRPTRYAAYSTLVRVLGELRRDAPLADVGLLWSLTEQRLHIAGITVGWEELFKHWMELEQPKEAPRWWASFRALQEDDADFRVVDAASDPEYWPPVIIWAGEASPADRDRERILVALAAGSTLLVCGVVETEVLKELRSAGRVVVSSPRNLLADVEGAGAKRYLSVGVGLWSFAYEDEDGAKWAFLVNPSDRALELRPSGELATDSGCWREVVAGTEGDGGLEGAAREIGRLLEPKTVRVVRLDP